MDMAEKDDSEGRCPACRSPYNKEKIVGMAAKCERFVICGFYILLAQMFPHGNFLSALFSRRERVYYWLVLLKQDELAFVALFCIYLVEPIAGW